MERARDINPQVFSAKEKIHQAISHPVMRLVAKIKLTSYQ